jgi:hypothetical protein
MRIATMPRPGEVRTVNATAPYSSVHHKMAIVYFSLSADSDVPIRKLYLHPRNTFTDERSHCLGNRQVACQACEGGQGHEVPRLAQEHLVSGRVAREQYRRRIAQELTVRIGGSMSETAFTALLDWPGRRFQMGVSACRCISCLSFIAIIERLETRNALMFTDASRSCNPLK